MKNLPIVSFALFLLLSHSICAQDQNQPSIQELQSQIEILRTTELIQSMSQRSEIMPSYHHDLKALIARQAYNFWIQNKGEKYVSHKNVYAALYYANKYLEYDSLNFESYNQVMAHNEAVVSLKFGKDPKVFYSAGSDGKVLKWNLDDIKGIPTLLYQGDHLIRSIDVSFDDQMIMITTKNQGLIFVSTSERINMGEITPVISRDNEEVQSAVFFPNEYKYLAVNKQGEIRIKAFNTDSVYRRKNKQQVNTVLVQEDNQNIYLGGKSGKLEIITDKLDSAYLIPELFAINALAISSDKKLLAVGREKGDAIIIDLTTHQIVRTISGHQSAVTDVDFNQNDQLLLTASRDGTTRIWDINNSRIMPLILDDHEDWVFTAKFTPTGDKVVTGSKDKNIRVWTIDYQQLADRICRLVDRNLTLEEWNEYIGDSFPYEETCPVQEY
ncbi:hypothetical protein N6H18_14140 [Reichenbachiella agarivorans]|uniref:WD domain-containing protein, G-beta repeat-containing protein n=1 Tax=Reichenbachiella agarivorans TaxID=2979464 RepID=A0ABY6CLV3_9BACT|nr:hypothetical protein [Reichenbachiella agarivorans]UXP31488.1 hypothetical protein N6H18_14140 [Reichenbachiella agarivorans]